MMKNSRLFAAVLSAVVAFLTLNGCAASPAGSGSVSQAAAPRTDRFRMDTTEIRNHGYNTVYQAIMSNHPDWFRAVGGSNAIPSAGRALTAPVVGIFIDGSSKPQDVEYLKGLVPGDVRAVRRMPASESLVTYGPDWAWGAIVVILR